MVAYEMLRRVVEDIYGVGAMVERVAAAGTDEAEPGGGDRRADRFGPAGALGFPAQVLQCPLLTRCV